MDPEITKRRLASHVEETDPIIEIYRAEGKVRDVDTNRSMEEVYPELLNHFA
jgi:adenylate kinase family enzyme